MSHLNALKDTSKQLETEKADAEREFSDAKAASNRQVKYLPWEKEVDPFYGHPENEAG